MNNKKEQEHFIHIPGLAHSPQARAILDILTNGTEKEKEELFKTWKKHCLKKGKERWGEK